MSNKEFTRTAIDFIGQHQKMTAHGGYDDPDLDRELQELFQLVNDTLADMDKADQLKLGAKNEIDIKSNLGSQNDGR